MKPFSGSQTHLKSRCIAFGLSDSHFVGQAHNKGKIFDKMPIEQYLVQKSTMSSDKLRRRLIAEGFKQPKCEMCDLSEWNGKEIPLELDHKNSDHWDNRLDNLQIVCPNCHALETRDRRQARVSQRQRKRA